MTTVLILFTSSMECMMTNITQTLVKKDMVMKLVISRESILYTFLMEGSSMSSTMLMVTMAVLLWRSNIMEKHIILMLSTMGVMVIMDMVQLELLVKIHTGFMAINMF